MNQFQLVDECLQARFSNIFSLHKNNLSVVNGAPFFSFAFAFLTYGAKELNLDLYQDIYFIEKYVGFVMYLVGYFGWH